MSDLSPYITVAVDGEDREVFMSFGLVNELAEWAESPETIAAIPLNADMRNEFLTKLLSKRKKSGKLEEKIDIDEVDISIEDAEALIQWGMQHLLRFFIRAIQSVQNVLNEDQERITGLASTLVGSKD